MASVSPFLVGFLVFLTANGALCFDYDEGGMEQDELFGLFEVMGSLLEDPTWAQMHPLPCTDTPWPGVECELLQENSTFHVTKIHLGPDIVTPPCKNSAKISESLPKLPYLKTLSLMNCFTKFPVSLSAHFPSSLEHLALDSNPSLYGEIPSTISNLSGLQILILSQNNLSGKIPVQIGGLVNLQQLDLSHNNLTGSVPEEIGNLKSLSILDLSFNSLQQNVPGSMGKLQFLEKIDLSCNKLQGTLPQELGKLKRLVLLDLSYNFLTGPVPENLSGLNELQYLIMENNPLNVEIPSFIESLVKLRVLTLSGCGLVGKVSNFFAKLTNLTALSLDNNSLNGTVPQELGTLQNLETLNLSRNQLRGELLFDQEFVNRVGLRLDIRGNNGLCTNLEGENKKMSSRLMQNQNPSCLLFPGATNKTLSENQPDPRLVESSKTYSSDQMFVVFSCLMFLFLFFGS